MFIKAPTESITICEPWPRPPRELVAAFLDSPAANVADALDRLFVMDSRISPVTTEKVLVGPALTILTRAGDNLAIHRALDDAQPGDVLVVSGQGDESRAVLGDLVGEIMLAKGVIGAVVDGAVRDVGTLSAQGHVVFARAQTPAGPFKAGPGMIGAPIACGGVVVNPGDLIVGDADGVAVVPAARMEWAAERVKHVGAFEDDLRQTIRAAAREIQRDSNQ